MFAPFRGAFAKVLGRYVRDNPLLDLPTAIAKMTLLPARRLDADITVFDPATVIDRATYADAFQPSSGIVHVLVNGVPVVRGGVLRSNVLPGRMLTGAASKAAPK